MDGMGASNFGIDVSQASLHCLLGGEDMGLWISFGPRMDMGAYGCDSAMSIAIGVAVPLYI